MNNENFHPIQQTPPNAHALHKWREDRRQLCYEYNGADIITVSVMDGGGLGYRHGSDGSLQSMSYYQQIYICADKPTPAQILFRLKNPVNMRPRRAGGDEAILGQAGRPLMNGVCGLYDKTWDLLIDWHGADWKWNTFRGMAEILESDGWFYCKLDLTLCEKPVFINIRPRYYQKHLGYSYHKPWEHVHNPKTIAGWCSWEAYRRFVDIGNIRGISEFMGDNLKKYGMEYIQVDDGYQKMPLPYDAAKTMPEGWLACDEAKFPGGHAQIVGAIKNSGLKPAVWVNANITNPDFPEKNPKDVFWSGGKPMMGEWIDFICSCEEETLAKHVEPLFAALREQGYEYIKIDAIRHLLYDGLHERVRQGLMTDEEAERRFRAYMEATRRGMGDCVYYLASWGELGEVVGLADACRIATDANPTWAGVRMQLFESARWFHTHRVLFLNDPDHVCVRTRPDWARTVLSLISLTGQLYMLSDPVEAYDPEKLDIIRKTLPPLPTMTAETGPLSADYPAFTWTKLHGFAVQSSEKPVEAEEVTPQDALNMAGVYPTMDDDHPFSTLWAFHIRQEGRAWCVMARTATAPLKKSGVKLENLGLDANKKYAAFDFWNKKYLGVIENEVPCGELSIGQCQIIALREITGEPFVLASTRHVSMDAVSIARHAYAGGALNFQLNGVAGTSETYYVYIPERLEVAGVRVGANNAIVSVVGGLCSVTVPFGEAPVNVEMSFRARQ